MKELFNNTKIRVTPEQSRRVQELAFENGLKWVDGGTLALNGSEEFLIFYAGKTVTCCTTEKYFKSHPYREITFSDLFQEKKELGIPQDIRDEMDSDMEEGCMPQGEIESCLNHWNNKYDMKRKDSNDLSSWSPADLWAAEQKCERMYIAAIPKHETSLWNKRAAKYHNELLKRIESGTK